MLACCFVGHRNIEVTEALTARVKAAVSGLISKGIDTFYFGSKSQFDNLCYEIVTDLKSTFPNIRRVYVRAEYQYADEYLKYLLQHYEDTFYPAQVVGSGKAVYVRRNQVMIDASDYCLFYYNPDYVVPLRQTKYTLPTRVAHSGTKLAYEYALSRNKKILNLYEN